MFVSTASLPSPHAPFRQPDWRWLRCQYLFAHGQQPLCGRDDGVTRLGCKYLEVHDGDTAHACLDADVALVAEAYSVFATTTALDRAELEARVLAGESDAQIALKCGLSAAAVRLFHDLFFDVRSSLDASYYIINVVIGPRVHRRITEKDSDVLMKLVTVHLC